MWKRRGEERSHGVSVSLGDTSAQPRKRLGRLHEEMVGQRVVGRNLQANLKVDFQFAGWGLVEWRLTSGVFVACVVVDVFGVFCFLVGRVKGTKRRRRVSGRWMGACGFAVVSVRVCALVVAGLFVGEGRHAPGMSRAVARPLGRDSAACSVCRLVLLHVWLVEMQPHL